MGETYQKYMKKHPNVPVVELDTVIGKLGDGQVLLTFLLQLLLNVYYSSKKENA